MFTSFRSRSLETERLDRGEYTHAEYLRWQKEMWFIHRLFGETRALKRTLLCDAARNRKVSILDIGAGSGTLLNYVRGELGSPASLLIGVEMSSESAKGIAENGHVSIRGDALHLPFADRSIDYVFCTLLLHHLDDSAAGRLLIEMQRVARRRMIVIDLERSAFSYLVYRILGRFLLQRFTREDGALSIKRAFKRDELQRLADGLEIHGLRVERSAIGRLIVTANG